MTPPGSSTSVVDGIGDAPATIPVVLLPIRIETRYVGSDLLVRVYPDRWHQYSHQAALTMDEAAAGEAVWAAAGDARLARWSALCGQVGTPRATWVVRATQPGSTPDVSRDTSWDQAVVAHALPDRWVVAGYGPLQADGDDPADQDPIVVAIGSDVDEDLAIGPTPGADPPAGGKVRHVDAGMAWLVDFDEAIRVGMAIRVPNPPAIQRLVVVGLRAASDGSAGGELLTELLVGHKYTNGLSLIAQGTSTNAEQAPGVVEDDETTLARATGKFTADPASDGFRLASTFGVDASALADVAGSDGHENQDAQAANAVFWHAGWGNLFARQLGSAMTDDTWEKLRQHFVGFVRARGPVSAVRIGDQPFGVLPILKQDLSYPTAGEDPVFATLGVSLHGLGPAWRSAGALRLTDSLADRVRRTPRTMAYYARGAWQPVQAAGWFTDVTQFMGLTRQQIVDAGVATAVQVEHSVPLLDLTFSWEGPAVLLPGAGSADPTTAILTAGGGTGLAAVPPANQVDVQLDWLGHAAARDLQADASQLVGPDSLLRIMIRSSLLRALAQAGVTTPPASVGAQPVKGRLDGVADTPVPGGALTEAYAALALLGLRTPAELELLLAESVELASSGWHAWMTSLASRRLALSRQAGVTGILLGAYGVVDAPARNAASASHGYLTAPSVGQAVTAAILHSAALNHGVDPGRAASLETLTPMSVKLSSARVRRAEQLLSGVRQGDPIGVLLGYQFERQLQDSGHGDYIAPLRSLVPLDSPADSADPRAVSAVATNVVDGLALSRLRHGPAGIPWGTLVGPSTLGPLIPDIEAALDDLDDSIDAVSDVLLAEGVHASVNGQTAVASAALDSAARGTLVPPEPVFVSTPRTGVDLTHRIIGLAPSGAPSGWPTTPSAADAPALTAWAGQAFGPPDDVDVALQPIDTTTGDDLPTDPILVPLTSLSLGPLDLVRLSGAQREFDIYVRWWAARDSSRVPGLPAGAGVRLASTNLAGSGRARLGPLLATAGAAAALLGQCRGLDGRDLSLPGSSDPAADLDELGARTDAARQQLVDLDAALAGDAGPDQLEQAFLLGIPGVLAGDPGDAAATAVAVATAREMIAVRQAQADAIGAPSGGTPAAQLAALVDTMQALRGDRLPVLADLTMPPSTATEAIAGADVTEAPAGQEPASWLARIARVSPPTAALETLCCCSELIGGGQPLAVQIGQLPSPTSGAATVSWAGFPLAAQSAADRAALPVRVSLAFVGPVPETTPIRLAGVLVDEWAETIPGTTQTAGVSFQFETPRAQAPQAVLVVTPTGLPQSAWKLSDLSGAAFVAMELATARLAELARSAGRSDAARGLSRRYRPGCQPDRSRQRRPSCAPVRTTRRVRRGRLRWRSGHL